MSHLTVQRKMSLKNQTKSQRIVETKQKLC